MASGADCAAIDGGEGDLDVQGSADVLEELGLNLSLSPDQVKTSIEKVGIGFMFAPNFHPAMKYAVGPRRELGQRTVFNILGPLTNPANASCQLVGVFDPDLTHPLAEVLRELGGNSAYVVHSHHGLDELSTCGANQVSHLKNGKVTTFELDAKNLGLRECSPQELKGGDPQENARILKAILSMEDDSPRQDVVLLNAAAALATETGDFQKGLAEARQSLVSGTALEKLNALISTSQSFPNN